MKFGASEGLGLAARHDDEKANPGVFMCEARDLRAAGHAGALNAPAWHLVEDAKRLTARPASGPA